MTLSWVVVTKAYSVFCIADTLSRSRCNTSSFLLALSIGASDHLRTIISAAAPSTVGRSETFAQRFAANAHSRPCGDAHGQAALGKINSRKRS